MKTLKLSVPLVVAALLAPASAQAKVLTVDDDGNARFKAIQPAVDAARAGDVILVRPGAYKEFKLVGKGVAIVGDGAGVRILPTAGANTTLVSRIPAGQRAFLRGLTFVPPIRIVGNTLRVESSPGTVWLEDVVVETPRHLPLLYFMSQREAVLVIDSPRVVIARSDISGAGGAPPGKGLEVGSIGLTVENSTVFAHGCKVTAGGTIVQGGRGLTGALALGGLLVLRDSRVQGAAGGPGHVFCQFAPGDGGPGLTLRNNATAWSINSQLLGGPGGKCFFGNKQGKQGPPFLKQSGTLTENKSKRALLSTRAVARDESANEKIELNLETEAGAIVFLLARFGAQPVFLPSFPDFVAVGIDPLIVPAGKTDANGKLALEIGVPKLLAPFVTWNVTAQMLVFPPDLVVEFSTPSIITVVDDGF